MLKFLLLIEVNNIFTNMHSRSNVLFFFAETPKEMIKSRSQMKKILKTKRYTWESKWNLAAMRMVYLSGERRRIGHIFCHRNGVRNDGRVFCSRMEDPPFVWIGTDWIRNGFSRRRACICELLTRGVSDDNVQGLLEWPKTITNEQIISSGVVELTIK